MSFALAACGEITGGSPDAPTGSPDAAIDSPQAVSCTNGVRDGTESDVDCGGGCDPCGANRACGGATDCISMVCTNQLCQPPSCADGVRNGNELDVDCAGSCGPGSCDPGQACGGHSDCASNLCAGGVCAAVKRVFVSSAIYSGGQVGNLAGGDQKCQAMAMTAGLSGTFRAWLSTTGTNAGDRILATSARFVLVDGTPIADNKADLLDGTLDNPIAKTETGAAPGPSDGICDATTTWVHGSTRSDGTLYDANANCANFTVDTGGGGWGKWDTAGSTWSHACGGGAPVNYCAKRAHLYCFEE
jgi:hypothetical protein